MAVLEKPYMYVTLYVIKESLIVRRINYRAVSYIPRDVMIHVSFITGVISTAISRKCFEISLSLLSTSLSFSPILLDESSAETGV